MIDFDELDEVEPERRAYDLIVFGATGFSGCLVVEHLDALLSLPDAKPHRWAVAGRSSEKLQKIAAKCKSMPKVVVASTKEEIHQMAADCQVLLALAGPYLEMGEEVVRACVENGTHYVDITGEVNFGHRIIQRYHAAAKEKGVMVVQFAGAMSVPDDMAAYLLASKFGPLRQLRDYTWGVGLRSGGSFSTGLTVVEHMLPDSMAVYHDPFSLGGKRDCGIRPEEGDCREAEPDRLFPSTWVMPAYGSHTGARVLRRSCGLFEDLAAAGEGAPVYGSSLSVVVQDLALDMKDAKYAVFANPVPVDIKDTMKQARTMEEMRKRSLVPEPGQGPPREARAGLYVEWYVVAESEGGDWAHVHVTGPEGYEVTAITCACAALVLLEECEALCPQERGGVLTPAVAFHGSSFLERMQAHAFAAGTGQKICWEVRDGQPAEAEILEALNRLAAHRKSVDERLEKGAVKAWDVPALVR